MFKKVRVLIWDFDGTLYKPNQGLWKAVREAEYQVIVNHTKWSRPRVIEEFEKIYKKITPSATESVADLSGITTPVAAKEISALYDRRKYITKDTKLVQLFTRLSGFRHFILANGIRKNLEETLVHLGLKTSIFEDIVTSEIVGVNKPHTEGFLYIIKKTGLPPEQHMMIGDREAVDLVPAKSVGMKTCLVWNDQESNVADVTVSSAYDIATLFH